MSLHGWDSLKNFRDFFPVIKFPQTWPRKRLLSWTRCCLPTFTEFWRNIRQCGKLCAPLRFVTLDSIPSQISPLLHWLILCVIYIYLTPSLSHVNSHTISDFVKFSLLYFVEENIVSCLNFHIILNIVNHQSDIFCKQFLKIWENLKAAEQSLKKTKFRQ